MRKRVAVRATGGNQPLLNAIDVESFTTEAQCELGGLGQPVFIADSVFMGLEYPAARNEVIDNAKAKPPGAGFSVALRHLPGKTLTQNFLESKTAVLGVGKEGAVERAFAKYIAKIRIPPRTNVHYNSWYDIRQDKMSTEAFLETFAGFKKNLRDKYGVRMDSFVPDDGWQDRSSIWEINAKLFPKGFGELAAGLKAGGSCLGLWHPLTACKGNLDMEWCQAHGYETDKAGSHLCLSAPNHNRQLREVMTRQVKEYGINYFKHDFNSFACDGEGHGHLPKSEYGFEANVDAYIEFLKLFRQLNPDIFLNCTGGMWLSPWWLMHCNTVWRGASDTGYEKLYPFVDQRAQAISYVDGVLYDNFVTRRYQFPISALMVHGIVYGQLHMLGGKEEPLESWTDNAVWAVSLGLMMKELYITPSLLSDAHWDVLGKCLQWAEANKDVLVETQMIGGNPHAGEAYGYKHAVGNRTILFLRNPSLCGKDVSFDLAPPDGDATPRLVEVVYPLRKTLSRSADPRHSWSITLEPNGIMVIEAFPASEIKRPIVEGCAYSIVSQSEKEFVFDLIGWPTTLKVSCASKIKEVLVDNEVRPVNGASEATISLAATPASLQELRVEDLSGAEAPLKNLVRATLPADAKEGKFCLICEKTAGVLPLSKITVNGKPAKTNALTGDRWKTFIIPLDAQTNEISWNIEVAARPKVPFASKSFVMSSYAAAKGQRPAKRVTVRLSEMARPATVESAGPPAPALPTPFATQMPCFAQVQPPREVKTIPPGGFGKITQADLRTIKAARLHFAVFGANDEEQYRNKPVTLNGVEIGILPPNPRHRLDDWVERVMEIPKDNWAGIAANNVITVANCGGDCFKFGDVALAVQLADGSWVESNQDTGIYCSGPGWLYSEGTFLTKNRSPEIKLSLPVK
jgi:hypothetical protein